MKLLHSQNIISKYHIFLCLLICMILIGVLSGCTDVNSSESRPTTPILNDIIPPPLPTFAPLPPLDSKMEYFEGLSKDKNIEYRIEISNRITDLIQIAASIDILDPNFLQKNNAVMIEITKLQKLDKLYLDDYLAIIEQEKWDSKMAEYPVATTVWLFLKKELGYSDYVCAGIMGNMMTECGGQTLKLNPNIYGYDNLTSYYGLCQWSKGGHGEVHGTDLNYQLEYLKKTIEYEFNSYGFKYEKHFKYESFLELQNAEQVALAFAKCYERCDSRWYDIRLINANKAYEYFTSDTRE
jgi:hypothetical protein